MELLVNFLNEQGFKSILARIQSRSKGEQETGITSSPTPASDAPVTQDPETSPLPTKAQYELIQNSVSPSRLDR